MTKITDKDLLRVGSKLQNKTFDRIMIFKTNVINIRKDTFGETNFTNIDIYNNTELQTIDENAFKKHEPFYDLKLNSNPKLKTDSIFSLYKALNPQKFFSIDQNIEKLPQNVFEIPEPAISNLEAVVLSNNKLRIVDKSSFIDCPKIRYIELNHNLIESIEDFAFDL
jgi:hypothetical protein